MENKSLKEVYQELYELMKQDKFQDDIEVQLYNLKESKRILNENKCFSSIDTAGIVQKHIEHIDKLVVEKKALVNEKFKKECEDKLSLLFEDYLKAIKAENKEVFIKHDVIMELYVHKGYDPHLERMLDYMSLKAPINIVRSKEKEDGLRKVLITMTSLDFIELQPFIQKKMENNYTKFEVRLMYPDMKQRTVEEHNELLNKSENIDVRDGKFVSYFLNNDKFDIEYSKAREFIKERFIGNYRTSFLINNKIENFEMYLNINYQYKVADKTDGRIYNPFTDLEYREKQSLENTSVNKPKRPRM